MAIEYIRLTHPAGATAEILPGFGFNCFSWRPVVAGAAIALMLLSHLWEKMKSHAGFPDRRWRPVGLERLAHSMALEPERLAGWQAAQVLYVRHGDHGNLIAASTTQPSRPD